MLTAARTARSSVATIDIKESAADEPVRAARVRASRVVLFFKVACCWLYIHSSGAFIAAFLTS